MKNNKGFTFVELLAVIMILVFISLVTTPVIRKIITNVRKSAFQETVNRIIQSGTHYIEEYLIEFHDSVPYPEVFTCDGKRCSNAGGRILDFAGDVPISGTITIAGADNIYATYITNNKWCASGYKGSLDVADTCKKLDHTAPIINKENKIRIASTTNKVIVIFPIDLMIDNETDIIKYTVEIKKDDKVVKSYVRSSFKNETYVVFDKLNDNQVYNVSITGINGNNLTTTITKTIKTNELINPTIRYINTPILIQNNYFKKYDISIKFNNDMNYIKSTKEGIINKAILGICDDKYSCTPLNTKDINSKIWYKVNNGKITYTNEEDGTLYAYNTAVNLPKLDTNKPNINLTSTIVKSNIVIINYDAYDNESGIGSYTCKYGTTKNMSNKEDNVSSSNCIISNLKKNTKYYFEICIKDRIGNSNCITDTFNTLNSTSNFNITYDNEPTKVTNDYLSKQIIKINSKIDSYYIYSSRKASVNNKNIEICGNNILPSNCDKNEGYIIEANTWYKVKSNINVLYANDSNKVDNLIIYDGNTYNIAISKIENTLPIAPEISGGSEEWVNTPITVSISGEGSSYSGVDCYEYLLLESNIKPTTSFAASGIGTSITLTDSGTKYVYFRTVSKGNIKSLWSDVKIVNVDFETPTKTEFRFVKGYSSNIPQKAVQINVTAKDNIGIKEYQIDVDGDGNPDRTCDGIFIPEAGFVSMHLRFRAIDYASNIGDWSDEVILRIEN